MAASGVVNAIFGSYDLRYSKQWRDEDLAYREQEIQWLNDDIVRAHEWRNADIERALRAEKMEHEHLVCEARAEQLHTVSEQCALLCGFTVIAMSNLNIPEGLDERVLFLYGASATLVCVLLLLATIICTLLLVAVTRYAGHSLEESVRAMDLTQLEAESPFGTWWLRRCEHEQMTAYKFLLIGVVLFFFYLAVLSWIQFNTSRWTSGSISGLCVVGLLVWQLRLASRWRYLLKPPTTGGAAASASLRMSALASALQQQQQQHPSLPLSPPTLRKSSAAGSLIITPSPTTKLASTSYTSYR